MPLDGSPASSGRPASAFVTYVQFYTFGGTNPAEPRSCKALMGKKTVPSRKHLERQARIFLDLARSTKNPELAAALADSAANYTSQAETIETRDTSLRAPDVEM